MKERHKTGYHVNIEIIDVNILAENVAKCLAAINAMHE